MTIIGRTCCSSKTTSTSDARCTPRSGRRASAANGCVAQDAPVALAEAGADCVLLDLGLPDGSGFDLLRRWRR